MSWRLTSCDDLFMPQTVSCMSRPALLANICNLEISFERLLRDGQMGAPISAVDQLRKFANDCLVALNLLKPREAA